jgi:transcriptional regulator with XRE-family HTH domain
MSVRRKRSTVEVDRHVGARIRERRLMLGITQEELANLIGVTYQQEHKYESGVNRVSAGRLFDIAQALGVDVAYFFEGVGEQPEAGIGRQRLFLEVARSSAGMPETHLQALADLARALAAHP